MWRLTQIVPLALLFLIIVLGIKSISAASMLDSSPKNEATPSSNQRTEEIKIAAASPNEEKGSILQKKGKHFVVPILTYHYIRNFSYPEDKMGVELSVAPDVFDRQMQYLISGGYTSISLDNLAAAFAGNYSMPAKPVIITFDDSYIDSYSEAFPVLKKYYLRGTMLTVSDFVDTPGHVSWTQLTEMVNSGLIDIVSHSRTHPYLSRLSKPDLTNEVATSKKILEEKLGRKINWFGYPYGAESQAVLAEVKNAGYVGAVSTIPGLNQYQGEIFSLRRIMVRNVDGDAFGKLLTTPLTKSN